jgi:5-oxoprolinase (ATP-hydrolysing)
VDSGWRIWIDRGGTFTDVVARRPDGTFRVVKLLSENPERYTDAALAGVWMALGLEADAALPAGLVADVRIGTTIATNALLERKGAATLLVVNVGFGDLLRIGHQARPRLFDLAIRKPEPLYTEVAEVSARIDVEGRQLAPLDEVEVRRLFAGARARGMEACAIALIHAWKFPEQEGRLAELAREAGFAQISTSSGASPLTGLVARAQTTVADAYLSPVLRAYVSRVGQDLRETKLSFMQSNGGLASAELFSGKDAVLSGPAGGVVGAAKAGEAAGFANIIGFDMGGTSTDVSLYAGKFERTFETEIAGASLRTPMMAVHTVAAGGGSILAFDGARMRVGPESAGADPGPAGYRRGGPATVTDANILLGRIQPEHFPAIFGPNGDEPLDESAVIDRFAWLAAEIIRPGGAMPTPHDVAEGFLRIAVSNMAQAIKQVSMEKGRDPAGFALQAFGGAAGQVACLVADELGMETVLLHPFAGVLSAYGIGLAEQTQIRRQALERALDEHAAAEAAAVLERLAGEAAARLGSDGGTRRVLTAELRYAGADAPLAVPFGSIDEMRAAFDAAHRARYGFSTPQRALVLESVTAEVTQPEEANVLPPAPASAGEAPKQLDWAPVWIGGRTRAAAVYRRETLRVDDTIDGPALIIEAISTIVVDPGWRARMGADGTLVLTRAEPLRAQAKDSTEADPVRLELFSSLFMALADRMGAVLRNTSTSVNIRERLDFSCALFDAEGNLIANAPHVPVHLGAMGESVRTVLRSRGPTLRPGDMIALNNPFNGGTHLPDVTLIAPVFDAAGRELRFFVGNRGHHADIGGATPGSTPPFSRTLEEEGVVLDDVLAVSGGEFREAELRRLLGGAKWPARNPDANISDLRAQIAANRAGMMEAEALVAAHGWPVVSAYMRHVMTNAEESVRAVIGRLKDGAFDYPMDDGSLLRVAVTVDHGTRSARIDFTGTSAQRPGNFNAPPAVTRAAVLYVFRCLVASDLPLNEGCMVPLEIVVPEGTFLSPAPGSAVVAGNTEVSQAVVNALLGALGAGAASQGTMNNLLIGSERFQYYETICGGAGAGPGFAGADAVHTHMTNTRITDPEELELRYPMRLEAFSVRRGSGGDGAQTGGDGAVRKIRLLAPATVSVVSSRRDVAPFGLDGGGDGAAGEQHVERVDGRIEPIAGVSQSELQPGDAIVIGTPGGGGYGAR